MRRFRHFLLLPIVLLTLAPMLQAGDPKIELAELVQRIKDKIVKGEKTEAALAAELKEFDKLATVHDGEKTDEVAQIGMMKALVYTQVLNQPAKAKQLFQEVATKFPETQSAAQVPQLVAALNAQINDDAASEEARRKIVGRAVPEFNEQDLEGRPLSVASRKGKVLLLDFWATWCPPCVRELPNLQKMYGKYHPKGFEIIGISLDEDKETLTSFVKEKGLSWPIYFDGKKWGNKIVQQYGVDALPTTVLLDRQGKVLAVGLMGEELGTALESAFK